VSLGDGAADGVGGGAGESAARAVAAAGDVEPILATGVTDGSPVVGALKAGAHAVKRQAANTRRRIPSTVPLKPRAHVRFGQSQLLFGLVAGRIATRCGASGRATP
jgi:hypothetical protein